MTTPPPQGPWGPYQGWQPPPPPPPPGSRDATIILIAMLVAGVFAYSVVNGIVGFFIFFSAIGGANKGVVIGGAVLLAVVGLGGGLGFGLVRRPWSRGLGLGLAIGWALWSMLTAGICTGLNPSLYG
ncbi:hypothetical protein [Nonomuraea sp. NPDC052265]|uniref:hypothetical protein n=1 Tax=Nonomuraea sp. NPDC052265 TaxID=3364374 RepID=UPI0037CABE0D